MAQHLVEGKSLREHVWSRSVNMGFYGGCIFGPAATLWFRFLQNRVVISGKPNLTIVARVLADQTVFASTNLFVFLNTMALLEGTDPKKKLETTYWNALSKNWMVWPFVQIVNFKFVPLDQRVLVVNVVSLGMFSNHKRETLRLILNSMELLPQQTQ